MYNNLAKESSDDNKSKCSVYLFSRFNAINHVYIVVYFPLLQLQPQSESIEYSDKLVVDYRCFEAHAALMMIRICEETYEGIDLFSATIRNKQYSSYKFYMPIDSAKELYRYYGCEDHEFLEKTGMVLSKKKLHFCLFLFFFFFPFSLGILSPPCVYFCIDNLKYAGINVEVPWPYFPWLFMIPGEHNLERYPTKKNSYIIRANKKIFIYRSVFGCFAVTFMVALALIISHFLISNIIAISPLIVTAALITLAITYFFMAIGLPLLSYLWCNYTKDNKRCTNLDSFNSSVNAPNTPTMMPRFQ